MAASLGEKIGRWLKAKIKAGVQAIIARLRPARSPEELAEINAQLSAEKKARAQYAADDAEAAAYAKAIRDSLFRQGIYYEYKQQPDAQPENTPAKSRRRYRELRLRQPYVITNEQIKFQIDTDSIYGPNMSLERLAAPQTLRLLSHNCYYNNMRHRVDFVEHQNVSWFVVNRTISAGGVPGFVSLPDMLKTRPADMAGKRFAFPVGIGAGGETRWIDLTERPGLLITGSSGGGKSNEVNLLMCMLLSQNTPAQCQFVLFDLKQVELTPYAETPHVVRFAKLKPRKPAKRQVQVSATLEGGEDGENVEEIEEIAEIDDDDPEDDDPDINPTQVLENEPAVITEPAYVPDGLRQVLKEIKRRYKLFKAKPGQPRTYKKISEWNQAHYNTRPLPYWFVVVDELSETTKRHKQVVLDYIERITSLGRAAGVLLVACTQTANKNTIPTEILQNLTRRIVFAQENKYMSQLMINSYAASELTTEGRAFYKSGKVLQMVQAPRITEEEIAYYIALACGRAQPQRVEASGHKLPPMDIFEWAVAENKSRLDQATTVAYFKEKDRTFSARDLAKIFEAYTTDEKKPNGLKPIRIGDHVYKLLAGRGGFPPLPYRLMPLTPTEQEKLAALQPAGDTPAIEEAPAGITPLAIAEETPGIPPAKRQTPNATSTENA